MRDRLKHAKKKKCFDLIDISISALKLITLI